MMATENPRSHDDYTVGWICALPLEMAAAKLMLDVIHPSLPIPSTDQNTYIFGNIGDHNIVVACLPAGAYGTISAATVAVQLLSSFHSIRFGLLVGIGGGVPSSNADIRLGDVVVSQPEGTCGGVIQYDLGKALSGGQFQRTGMLNRPPKILLTALATLQAHHLTEDSRVHEFFSNIQVKTPCQAANFARPSQEDCLYQTEYHHGSYNTCVDCDPSKLISRPLRDHDEPIIHYGLIASANQVVKDGRRRDQLAQEFGVSCVEMEAAGLMNDFPCLVIRGICDYADSHKNKEWQGYAAAVAAAYTKELLLVVPINQIDNTPMARNALADSVTILHGLGGMGKTQLAIRFAREHKDDFTAIFWLSGKSRDTLLQSLSSVLPRLPGQAQNMKATNKEEIEQYATQVLQWLAIPENSRWLVIFDNIDQYSPVHDGTDDGYDIGEFFPTADHGSILITSRLQILTDLGISFPIQKLKTKDAIELLLQSSGISIQKTIREEEIGADAIALAGRLDGLPLAIVIAGAYMHETGTSISEYLQYYQKSWHDLQLYSRPRRHYQQGNILQTWMISYREIKKRHPNAAELLLLLAHFDNQDICLIFKETIRTLIGFSLIEVNQPMESYAMHPVVQEWCIDIANTKNNEKASQWNELAMVSIGYMVPPDNIPNYWEVERRLLAHADFVQQRWMSDRLTDNIAIWGAFHGLGNLYQHQDKPKEAKEMFQRALTGYENALGPDHIATLGTINNLGFLYQDQGKLKEAEETYQQALAGFEKVLGPDHTSTLNTVNNLGFLYRNQGKLKEAKEMFQRALTGYENALGPDHTSTLGTVNDLGLLYSDQDKLKEAEELFQRALTGYEKALGPDHTSTLVTVNNLGNLYSDQGKLKEAKEMFQRALTGYEKALGPDHTLHSPALNNNLGILYFYQGKLKEAEEMYQRALAGKEKTLGLDHTSTLDTVNNLGLFYSCQGKLKEAEEMYQRALAGKEKALGPDHISTLDTINNLGNLHSDQGKLKEAREMYQRALAGKEKALGPDHTSTLDTVNNLGFLYFNQGKLKQAEEMYQRALAGYEKALGPDHISTLTSVNNLRNLYSDRGKLKKGDAKGKATFGKEAYEPYDYEPGGRPAPQLAAPPEAYSDDLEYTSDFANQDPTQDQPRNVAPRKLWFDMGIGVSLTSREVLDEYYPEVPLQQRSESIGVKGTGTEAISSHDFVNISLDFPAMGQADKSTLIRLPANCKWSLSLPLIKRQVTVRIGNAIIPVRIKPRKDYQRFHPVYLNTKAPLRIAPKWKGRLPIYTSGKDLHADQDYIFNPGFPKLGLFSQVIDHRSTMVKFANLGSMTVTIPQGTRLGYPTGFDEAAAKLVAPEADGFAWVGPKMLPKEREQRLID
ncbi:Nephrocystin-3 [Talaromyces islandicus]|uniref:Nephrocystin-3 n=1 Tax=Talaromyces islandicus TaxID=28573 RepID=A0A0U1LZG3_TALIS|nr:Nephrocystin-3 [Talaromyces islandicus]